MNQPIEVDLPHSLGKEAVKARLAGGVGQLGRKIPGGARVDHFWEGDTMHFVVHAMGQQIASRATCFDDRVHASIDLPGLLSLFAGPIRAAVESEAPKLLK